MKIGIICYPTYGGSGVVATELGKELSQKGHEVHFITYNQPFRLDIFEKNIYYHEVRVKDYPLFDFPPYELVLSSKLVDVVKYEKLDLLHVHYAIPHASAAYMAQQILEAQGIYIPFITTLHGTDITLVGKDPSFEPVITFAINKSDAVTAVSNSLKMDTYEHFDINREIEVIPNFINMEQYSFSEPLADKTCYAPNGEKIVTHISNFRKVKRVQDIVKFFGEFIKHTPSKLLLIGDGPERTNIEILCRNLGICDSIKFLGKLRSTKAVLSISDLFILPSEFESFGLAALEAMACGVPVISTNTGGLPEVNKQGVSGFLSNVGDIKDMVKNAQIIFKDDASLKKFKKNAFEVAKTFDNAKILPMYEQLYEKTIEAKKQLI